MRSDSGKSNSTCIEICELKNQKMGKNMSSFKYPCARMFLKSEFQLRSLYRQACPEKPDPDVKACSESVLHSVRHGTGLGMLLSDLQPQGP